MKHIAIILGLVVMIMTGCSKDEGVVAGYIEKVKVNGNLIPAKLDTGADICAVDADVIRTFKDGKKTFVEFDMITEKGEKINITAERVRVVHIKLRTGGYQDRPVVKLNIQIGNVSKNVEVGLTNRRNFDYRVLLGRNFLKHGVLVNSEKEYILTQK